MGGIRRACAGRVYGAFDKRVVACILEVGILFP